MIVKEKVVIDEIEFMRTYSDMGLMIQRDDGIYEEAIDPVDSNREYAETDMPITTGEEDATEEDYQNALSEFGVKI